MAQITQTLLTRVSEKGQETGRGMVGMHFPGTGKTDAEHSGFICSWVPKEFWVSLVFSLAGWQPTMVCSFRVGYDPLQRPTRF